jgi:hypothetical protein
MAITATSALLRAAPHGIRSVLRKSLLKGFIWALPRWPATRCSAAVMLMVQSRITRPWRNRSQAIIQSPVPGLGEKYWSLSGFPSHSFQSAGGAFLATIFGQIFAYSAFSDSHFSSPGSVSALIALTGHSGSQTLQSMHSSGWMTSMFSPS